MGRHNKTYSKSLHQQAYDRLTSMQAFGESKKDAKEMDIDKDKIFSFNTYQTYWKHTKYFVRWVQEMHPDCTTLKKAKSYVNEWLQTRVDKGLSAWTIHTESAALNKLYGIKADDPERFRPPKRVREDIKRSRGSAKRDRHFSITNNDELIRFCKGTGLRRSELVQLKGKDLLTKEQIETKITYLEKIPVEKRCEADRILLDILKDTRFFNQEYYIHVRNGKGGRSRISPILVEYSQGIVDRMKSTGKEEPVWRYINSNADIHAYRSEYATQIYKEAAREIKDIPYDGVNGGTGRKYQRDVYVCRKDESGKKLDKKAMLICSKALGHNRISVVANNYIRGI